MPLGNDSSASSSSSAATAVAPTMPTDSRRRPSRGGGRPILLLSLLLSLSLLLPRSVHGWGRDGHEIVANVAYSRLTPKARAAVNSILGNGTTTNTDTNLDLDSSSSSSICSSSPLAEVANWADEIRFREPWTDPLHYVDVHESVYQDGCRAGSIDCRFVYERDCVDDYCVAGSIANYTQRLGAALLHLSSDDSSRRTLLRGGGGSGDDLETLRNTARESLMFAVHFVGDVHQPLHVARSADKGGNDIRVHFAKKESYSDNQSDYSPVRLDLPLSHSAENLHSVWDTVMIQRAIEESYKNSQAGFCRSIIDSLSSPSHDYNSETPVWLECPDGRDVGCTSTWAAESLYDAVHYAYVHDANVGGGGGDGPTDVVSGDLLSEEYYKTRLDVVHRRLAMAGVRLAATLEAILASGGEGGGFFGAASSVEMEE